MNGLEEFSQFWGADIYIESMLSSSSAWIRFRMGGLGCLDSTRRMPQAAG
jgi:hypothetical protein